MVAGRRYIESDIYQRARASGRLAAGLFPDGLAEPVEILNAAEVRAMLQLRAYSDTTMFDIQGQPDVGLLPAATNFASFAETIPVERVQVELDSELSESELATAVNDGQPLPEGALNFGTTPTLTKVPRFGVAEPVTLGLLDEPGRVQSLIESRLYDGVMLGLDNDMINGNGFWTGAVAGAGLTQAKGSGYRIAAILNGLAQVQNQGWYARPLQIVTNPLTRAAVYLEQDTAGRPLGITEILDDTVNAWIPSKYMPVGQALVGDIFAGIGLFTRGGLEVSVSGEYMDFLTRSMVEMKFEFRAYSWVRQPNALCLVTGIA